MSPFLLAGATPLHLRRPERMDEPNSSRSSLPVWMLLLGTIGAVIGFSWSGKDFVAAGAVAAVGVCGVLGYLAGGIRLLGFFGSLIVAYKFTAPFAHWLAPHLSKLFTLSRGSSGLASLVTSCVLLVLFGSLIATLVSRQMTRRRPKVESMNRLLGLGLGAAEGSLIVFLLLSGVMAAAPLANQRLQAATTQKVDDPVANNAARRLVEISSQVKGSTLAPLFTSYNPFENMPHWKGVQRTASVIGNPDAYHQLSDHPAIARLQQKPSVRAAVESLANDPQLRALSMSRKNLDRDTAIALLNNPNVAKLFEQPELIQEILLTLGEMDAQSPDLLRRAAPR